MTGIFYGDKIRKLFIQYKKCLPSALALWKFYLYSLFRCETGLVSLELDLIPMHESGFQNIPWARCIPFGLNYDSLVTILVMTVSEIGNNESLFHLINKKNCSTIWHEKILLFLFGPYNVFLHTFIVFPFLITFHGILNNSLNWVNDQVFGFFSIMQVYVVALVVL